MGPQGHRLRILQWTNLPRERTAGRTVHRYEYRHMILALQIAAGIVIAVFVINLFMDW